MTRESLLLILIFVQIMIYAQKGPSFIDKDGFVIKIGQKAPDFQNEQDFLSDFIVRPKQKASL